MNKRALAVTAAFVVTAAGLAVASTVSVHTIQGDPKPVVTTSTTTFTLVPLVR